MPRKPRRTRLRSGDRLEELGIDLLEAQLTGAHGWTDEANAAIEAALEYWYPHAPQVVAGWREQRKLTKLTDDELRALAEPTDTHDFERRRNITIEQNMRASERERSRLSNLLARR